MHAQYHRPRQQPLIQQRPSWSSNIAPVAVMRQIPPVETDTQHVNHGPNRTKTSSRPISALTRRRPPPAYRGVLQTDKSSAKARSTSFPSHASNTHEHVFYVKPTVTIPVTTEYHENDLVSLYSFTMPQIERRLIVKFRLPHALLRSMREAEAANAQLERAFSTRPKPSDFSHNSQDRSLVSEPFGPYNYPQPVDVDLTGFKRPVTSSSSYPPSTLVDASTTTRNSSMHSNGNNTTRRPFVAKETAASNNTKQLPASLPPTLQQTTMRASNSSNWTSSAVPVNSIWSNAPVTHSNSPARRTISAASSSSSNTTVSDHRSSRSSLSHITVAAPKTVLPGIVKRPARQPPMGQEFSQLRPDEHRTVSRDQHLIQTKKRVPQAQQDAPSTPSRPAKRIRSGSLFQPSPQADSSEDSDDDIPVSQLKRRETRMASGSTRRRAHQFRDDDGDEEQPEESSPSLARSVQDELRDDFRTRGQIKLVNNFLGTSPAKEAPSLEMHNWIDRSDLLTVDPSNCQYPIALKSGAGTFSVIENEEDLLEEIESEKIRPSRSVSTAEITTAAPTSRTSTDSTASAPPPATNDVQSELRDRIELVQMNFAKELTIIKGIANCSGPTMRTERELAEIEREALVWLESYKVAQARFEAVCEKQRLFLPTMALGCGEEYTKIRVECRDRTEQTVDVKKDKPVGTHGESTPKCKHGSPAVLKKGVARKVKKNKKAFVI